MIWALVVIFVILIGGAVVVKVAFDAHLQRKQKALERRAWWLANSGVNRFLAGLNDPEIDPETLLETPFVDTISDNESIHRTLYPWGGALLAVATGRVGTVTSVRSRVIGQVSDLPDSVLVRTRSRLYPLVLAGATSAPVTQAGAMGLPVRVSSLGGKPTAGLYHGRGPTQTIVDGWVYTDTSVAELDPWLWKYELENLRRKSSEVTVTHFGTKQLLGVDLVSAFESSPVLIDGDLDLVDCSIYVKDSPIEVFARGRITIRGNSLIRGQVKFWARDEIEISDSSIIDGAALVSDSVIILGGQSNCQGHFLAGYTLLLDRNTTLHPGSTAAVYLSNDQGRTLPIHALRAGSTGKLTGHLALYVEKTDTKADIPRMKIDSNVTFTGVVTSNHLVENHSDVIAQFDIGAFWFRSSTTTYLNWIIDRRIMRRFEPTLLGVFGASQRYVSH